MATDNHETAKESPKKQVFTFFVSGKKYETDQESLDRASDQGSRRGLGP
ncbi:hypothetical protein ACVWZ3_009902 [Bradyrhizobium sp. i1.3.6]